MLSRLVQNRTEWATDLGAYTGTNTATAMPGFATWYSNIAYKLVINKQATDSFRKVRGLPEMGS